MQDASTLDATLFDLASYDYPLPEALIARYPLAERDASRMMLLNRATGGVEERHFSDFASFLSAGDVLVLNNTQVLPARFFGHRRLADGSLSEGSSEFLLLHPHEGHPLQWHCLMKPAKRLPVGMEVVLEEARATFTVLEKGEMGQGVVGITLGEGLSSVEALMDAIGHMPIPPYFNRPDEPSDRERYQSVFAKEAGAQAAPTASLHFTTETLAALKAKGVVIVEVTLAVGIGTFKPVVAEDIREHRMDGEAYQCPQEVVEAVRAAKARGNKVFAVGTTAAKTLETVAAAQGGQLCRAASGWSEHFIYPGVPFQVVDGLLTNFHLPKSTLMMLISAFASRECVLAAYAQAIASGFRFYSYGDCMLIL